MASIKSCHSRNEKPFEIVKSSGKNFVGGPETLERTSLKAAACRILDSLLENGNTEDLKSRVVLLPKLLILDLEEIVLREAEFVFSTKKFKDTRLKIFDLFFDQNLRRGICKTSHDTFTFIHKMRAPYKYNL